MQGGEDPEMEPELLAADKAIPGTPLLFLPESSLCGPCYFPCIAQIPRPQPEGPFGRAPAFHVLTTLACQHCFAVWVCGLLALALLLFSCGSLGISLALCKGDLI